MSAEVGQSAPEITLIDNERQSVALADIKGKTTEKMGLIGKMQGIASEVISSVTKND